MRLTPTEHSTICRVIRARDEKAKVYLYGSRVNDTIKGGDIDLLVVSETLGFSEKISVLIEIKDSIGEQRIDLMIKRPMEVVSDPFVQSILSGAIEL